MEIKTLAKNTAILASPKVLAFFVGILKSKLIAVLLGSTGFGIIDQLSSSINFIRQSTLSFLPDGMVKLLASENSRGFDKKEITRIIKTYSLMAMPILILVLVLSYTFIDELTKFILGDIKYKNYLLITLISVPIAFLSVSLSSLLKAFKEIRVIAMRQIYLLIINLITFIPLVYFFKIKGGVISVTLAFVASLVVNFLLVRKHVLEKYGISFQSIKDALFERKYFKELIAFISVGIVSGIFRVVENMTSRAIVVNELGIDQIGIYAPITKWQALFIGFILPSVFTYLYPRLSEAKDNKEINELINDVIRFITFVTLPFIIIGVTTRNWIIPLFYSSEFIEATKYLPYHFSFLLMAVWATIFEQLFASRDRLKAFLVFTVVIYSLSLFLVYYFVPKFGLYGYLLRFTITPFILMVTYVLFWKKDIGFKLKKENFKIVFYSFLCVILMLFIKDLDNYIQFIVGLVLISLIVLLLKNQERNFIVKKISNVIKLKK